MRVKFTKVFLFVCFVIPMKDPAPVVEKWTEIYNATTEKMYCMQKNYLLPNPTVSGVEDCLYLYVYRPKVCAFVVHSNNSHAVAP